LPHLQRLHEQFRSDGLVVLGLNCADDPEIAKRLLRENSVTFANVLDSSDAAQRVVFQDYRAMAVPLQYFIDREGTVVDAWAGEDEARARRVMAKLGVSAVAGEDDQSPNCRLETEA
jgi:peroxiredoxin